MTPPPSSWLSRCVAVHVTLSPGAVVALADSPDGPVRLTYAATGAPCAAPLTPEDRMVLRARLAEALGRRAAA